MVLEKTLESPLVNPERKLRKYRKEFTRQPRRKGNADPRVV